jgi:hypothetical protein
MFRFMSIRRLSPDPAKSTSAHPALIALARLLGRQAALEALKTGALSHDAETQIDPRSTDPRTVAKQVISADADTASGIS